MTMENSFAHTSKVLGFKLYNSDEGNLKLEVKTALGNLNLEGFIYGETSASFYRGDLKEEDTVKVLFKLLADRRSLRTLNRETKSIILDTRKNPILGNIDYIVQGQIMQVYSHHDPVMAPNYVSLVVDCGICLGTTIPKSINVKVGDYIQVEGRLDAHIIGKV